MKKSSWLLQVYQFACYSLIPYSKDINECTELRSCYGIIYRLHLSFLNISLEECFHFLSGHRIDLKGSLSRDAGLNSELNPVTEWIWCSRYPCLTFFNLYSLYLADGSSFCATKF